MYYNKSEKDMTDFERLRDLLFRSAYYKGMWESMKEGLGDRPLVFLAIAKEKIVEYTEVIRECYELIKEMCKLNMLEK